jgi:hypothetical protein
METQTRRYRVSVLTALPVGNKLAAGVPRCDSAEIFPNHQDWDVSN